METCTLGAVVQLTGKVVSHMCMAWLLNPILVSVEYFSYTLFVFPTADICLLQQLASAQVLKIKFRHYPGNYHTHDLIRFEFKTLNIQLAFTKEYNTSSPYQSILKSEVLQRWDQLDRAETMYNHVINQSEVRKCLHTQAL